MTAINGARAGILAALLIVSGNAHAQPRPFEILAEYPNGNFLENLDKLPDDRIAFTSYFAKTIEILGKDGKASTFASVSAHPVSILAIDDGFLVAAHGQPFVSGPAFLETQQFLLLDAQGKEIASFKAPDARFLNGMVRQGPSSVLVAGVIWQVDYRARTVALWLKDEALTQDPAVKEFRPGANGLKRDGERLIVSNSSRGTLSSISIKDGKPAGAVALLKQVGAIDDFALGRGGEIVFTTHGAKLLRLDRDGNVTTVMESGCDSCTAVAFANDQQGQAAVIVLTTGGLAEGGKEPARVLRVPYREPR